MTLGDTGPLVALIDADDPHHSHCKEVLGRLPKAPIVVTWPCITEAMYLLQKKKGFDAQDELWDFLANDLVRPYINGPDEWPRMRELMRRYRDTPMDLAEPRSSRPPNAWARGACFTLDRHFHVYRIDDQHAFDVV